MSEATIAHSVDAHKRQCCPHCDASYKHAVWRNFDEVLREADLYCGACGEFIREWNP